MKTRSTLGQAAPCLSVVGESDEKSTAVDSITNVEDGTKERARGRSPSGLSIDRSQSSDGGPGQSGHGIVHVPEAREGTVKSEAGGNGDIHDCHTATGVPAPLEMPGSSPVGVASGISSTEYQITRVLISLEQRLRTVEDAVLRLLHNSQAAERAADGTPRLSPEGRGIAAQPISSRGHQSMDPNSSNLVLRHINEEDVADQSDLLRGDAEESLDGGDVLETAVSDAGLARDRRRLSSENAAEVERPQSPRSATIRSSASQSGGPRTGMLSPMMAVRQQRQASAAHIRELRNKIVETDRILYDEANVGSARQPIRVGVAPGDLYDEPQSAHATSSSRKRRPDAELSSISQRRRSQQAVEIVSNPKSRTLGDSSRK